MFWLWSIGILYVLASYALFMYAAWHDYKLKQPGLDFTFRNFLAAQREHAWMPAYILAPVFSPVVVIWIVGIRRYIEPRMKEDE